MLNRNRLLVLAVVLITAVGSQRAAVAAHGSVPAASPTSGTSASQSGNDEAATTPQYTPNYVTVGLVVAAILVLVTPKLLACGVRDFYHIPYITWFLLHYCIAALGIIAIVLLRLCGAISPAVVSGLLGSLLGYVLGNAVSKDGATNKQSGPLKIVSKTLPKGTVNTAYKALLYASGGSGAYKWTIAQQDAPPWTTLDSTSGKLGGTPAAAGTKKLTVQVEDREGKTASEDFSIEIA